ncbi:hypothetical protein DSLASN_35300 [Desulfoluna limicola]|uniref:YtkA-like domain-containing protein n=1 Tax=Desulfoluna limicola TaxID=2810562 RepID=A0ABN6F6B5_9BACT|nr:hypothetical protein [Desulfoluna limicola]BCS97898.1 hypothetical protein DSLASN_35300 [Desulfoluna limicola]
MKRHALTLGLLALLTLNVTSLASAEHGHDQAGNSKDMKMDHKMDMKGHDMDMGPSGNVIRTHTIDGMKLTYRLINMHERMTNKPGMEMMADKVASHHMMVDVKSADGGMIHNAKVGFIMTGPDGKKTKAMAMGMEGGHGADMNMMKKGTYTVNVKIKAGDKTVKDTFTYVAE